MHILPPHGHGCIFTIFFFKKKKAFNPNVKILRPEGQISIYIVAQKT
jgi:hypothetical protein